ncbi:MAG: hypothetical protein Q9191_005680, partial [Dirinaria sp. TL-2023a]
MAHRRPSSPVVHQQENTGINPLASEYHFQEPGVDEEQPTEPFFINGLPQPSANLEDDIDQYIHHDAMHIEGQIQRSATFLQETLPSLEGTTFESLFASNAASIAQFPREEFQSFHTTTQDQEGPIQDFELSDFDDNADGPEEYFRSPVLPATTNASQLSPSHQSIDDFIEFMHQEAMRVEEQLGPQSNPPYSTHYTAATEHFEREAMQYLQTIQMTDHFPNLELGLDVEDGADEPEEYFRSPVLPSQAANLDNLPSLNHPGTAPTPASFPHTINEPEPPSFPPSSSWYLPSYVPSPAALQQIYPQNTEELRALHT